MTRIDPRDPRDVANYAAAEAAHYLGLPISTVRVWAFGQSYSTRRSGQRIAPPVFKPASVKPAALSFWNLVEVYVLASIRRYHGVSLQKVRRALRFVQDELSLDRPLIQQHFFTDGVNLFVERYAALINVTGDQQSVMLGMLRASVRRIEADPAGLAARVFPWIHKPDEPHFVEIDPKRAFGRLVIAGTGVPTETVAERFRAGDSVDSLTKDYRLTRDQIEAALRWEHCAAVH